MLTILLSVVVEVGVLISLAAGAVAAVAAAVYSQGHYQHWGLEHIPLQLVLGEPINSVALQVRFLQ